VKQVAAIPRITTHSNVEAEILAPLLLAAAGLRSVPAWPRGCEATGQMFVDTPLVRASGGAGPVAPTAADARDLLARVQLGDLALLASVDLLMGNADRSLSNVLLIEDGTRVLPIPIDHNAAFLIPDRDTQTLRLAGFVPGFGGVPPGATDNEYRRWQLGRCGTVAHILGASPLYQRLLQSDARRLRTDAAKVVVERLRQPVIANLVEEASRLFALGLPSPRLEELGRILDVRRSGLVDALFADP